jgi:hypothetical protein
MRVKKIRQNIEFTFFYLGILFTFILLDLKEYFNLSVKSTVVILLLIPFLFEKVIKYKKLKNEG